MWLLWVHYLSGPEEGSRPLGARVSCGCELLDMGAGNQTQILWKSSPCPQLPSRPSSLKLLAVLRSFTCDESFPFHIFKTVFQYYDCNASHLKSLHVYSNLLTFLDV